MSYILGPCANNATPPWAPGYALPGPGETLNIGMTNAPADINPAAMTDAEWHYALFGSFGGGVLVQDYSLGGGWVQAGSGGHNHPSNIGAIIADFTDRTWKRLDPQGGAYRGGGYAVAETSGSPQYEITGSSGVPAPAHPYHNQIALPASMGGGTKGSVLYVTRTAVCSEAVDSPRAHRMDLASGVWSQYSTNGSAWTTFEATAVLDAARSRAWMMVNNQHSREEVVFLNLSTGAFGLSASFSFPDSDCITGFNFMHAGLVMRHGINNKLFYFDPDDDTSGINAVTLSGTLPGGNDNNPFTYFPPTGKFYKLPITGGTTLYRLTPPATSPKTNTWTVDTITVSPSLPTADPGIGTTSQTTRWFYVPALQRLAWIPGGAAVHLVYPGS